MSEEVVEKLAAALVVGIDALEEYFQDEKNAKAFEEWREMNGKQ